MSTMLDKTHRNLLVDYVEEIEAALDRVGDDEVAEALDDLNLEISSDEPTHETLTRLVAEVSAYLRANDDEALEELHGMVLEIPRRDPANRPTT